MKKSVKPIYFLAMYLKVITHSFYNDRFGAAFCNDLERLVLVLESYMYKPFRHPKR